MGFSIGGFKVSLNPMDHLQQSLGLGKTALDLLSGSGGQSADMMSTLARLNAATSGNVVPGQAGGAQQVSPAEVEQLLRGLRELAQKDPTALKQALEKNPELAQLLAMLLSQGVGQQPAPAAPAAPAGGGHAAGGGGHAAGGGGGGHKGGIHVDGANGFLWKPVSDSDGRLAVLTPERFTGNVAQVVLKDQAGNVLETGRHGGVGNGGREHFRFSKPGGAYPPGVTVEVRMRNGGTESYPIAQPSQRYD
jgi:hypothetical protein